MINFAEHYFPLMYLRSFFIDIVKHFDARTWRIGIVIPVDRLVALETALAGCADLFADVFHLNQVEF